MFEFGMLALIGIASYFAFFKKDDEEKTHPAKEPSVEETEDFEKHLAAITEDEGAINATLRFYGMNPEALGDADRRALIASVKSGALAAWNNDNPHDLGELAFHSRLAHPRIGASEATSKHLAEAERAMRNRIEQLSAQGSVVDAMYNRLDSAPLGKTFLEISDEPAVKAAQDDANTIDVAATTPYFGVFSDKTHQTATVEKDGHSYPVFKDINLFMAASTAAGAPVKHAMTISAKLDRYVKRVDDGKGNVANVYVATVTSAVPDEVYNKTLFVYAPTTIGFLDAPVV